MRLSEESFDVVKRLWMENIKIGQIVAYFGGAYTRNQIIGKLYRAGLINNPNRRNFAVTTAARTDAAIREKRRTAAKRAMGNVRYDGMPPAPPVRLPIPSDAAQRSFNCTAGPSYGLMDLDDWHCHWPLGDPLQKGFCYCAAPSNFMSYCYHHTKISYAQRSL